MNIEPEKKEFVPYDKLLIGKRIKALREKLRLTRPDVFNAINVSRTTLQAWEMGDREASISGIFKLAEILNTTPEYLLTGNNEKNTQESESSGMSSEKEQFIFIPNYENIYASAGHGFSNEDRPPEQLLALPKEWFIRRKFNPAKLLSLRAQGDSMFPTIQDNDLIVINTDKIFPIDGRIYVIRQGERLLVKRLQLISKGIRLISDNKELYNPIELTGIEIEDFNIIGQVVLKFQNFPD